MEAAVVLGILGLGFFMKDDKNMKFSLNTNSEKTDKSETNPYESNRSVQVWNAQQNKANEIYKKFMNNEGNRIIAGPPDKLLNKVDYTEKELPVSFSQNGNATPTASNGTTNNHQFSTFNTIDDAPYTSGWTGVSLTGEPMEASKFTHNNMQPFFGGSIKQNVDEYANNSTFETYTGCNSNYIKKKEICPMFKPEMNGGNVYGTSNLDGYQRDRYIPSRYRNNESPIEKIYVGPGLNRGYTAKPTGGFQQFDTQEYALPKNVDELRTKDRPKIVNKGRIIAGAHIGRTGKVGEVKKNLPDTYYENTPDRYFTTTGDVVAAKQRPQIVLKNVNRKKTEGRNNGFGPAGTTRGSKSNMVRSTVKPSTKTQYANDGPRNMDATGFWSVVRKKVKNIVNNSNYDSDSDYEYDDEGLHDYGRGRLDTGHNNRECTGPNDHMGNVGGSNHYGKGVRNNQGPRRTRKSYIIGNPRAVGNMRAADNSKGVVYDPNQIARTTIKEQTIDNNHSGNMTTQDNQKGVVYDPNQIARTTIKEQTIDNDHSGYMTTQDNQKGIVYDPNQVARTTIKEQTIDNDYSGNVDSGLPSSYVKDYTDVARTTTRQTASMNDYKGLPSHYDNNAYAHKHANIDAKETWRQQQCREILGNAGNALHDGGGGHEVRGVVAVGTQRQITSQADYTGTAGPGDGAKQQSYEQIDNSTVRSYRGVGGTEHTPGMQGPNQHVNSSDINMTTKRVGDIQNTYVQERGIAPNKVYNSLPQANQCGQTQQKQQLSNQHLYNRMGLDGQILNAFKQNPYTQPLDSHWHG